MALTWAMRHPGVTTALIGASSVAQLDDSLAAAHATPLTDDELAAIEPHAAFGGGKIGYDHGGGPVLMVSKSLSCA